MNIVSAKILAYSEQHTSQESKILQKLNRQTHLQVLSPRMLSGHLQGRFLTMVAQMIRPKKILEIGTYTGYSAICLAQGLQIDGELHTIDINEELEMMAKSFFKEAGFEKQIIFHLGNALDIIPKLDMEFDLVFVDADKLNYPTYYEMALEKTKKGGFMLIDNVLWDGKVVQEVAKTDKKTKMMIEFNHKIQEDERVENVLLPIRDGLMLIRKI